MSKEQWQLLKQALREINGFAKEGKLVFTPKSEEGEMSNEEKTEHQK